MRTAVKICPSTRHLPLALTVVALLSAMPLAGQPGSGGVVKIQQATPQSDSLFGSALLAGQRTAGPTDDLYIGAPAWDFGGLTDAGRWERWVWSGRQASPSNGFSGPGAEWYVGTTFALAFSSDGEGRFLSGDPGAPVNGVPGSGRVGVVRSTIALGPNIGQDTPLLLDTPELDDEFGRVIVVGDFDGDGYDDIAVSAPGEDEEITRRALEEVPPPVLADRGLVHVYYGGSANTDFQTGEVLESPLDGTAATYFGIALAAGDFNGDGYDDLAVGEPLAVANKVTQAGAVHVFYGSSGGIQGGSPQTIVPSDMGISAIAGLEFGRGLAAADFNRNLVCLINNACRDDLAIGAPGYRELDLRGPGPGGEENEGGVVVAVGTSSGLSGASASVLQQNDLEADITLMPNSFDRFGEHLWAGNFDGFMGGDLAIGVPSDGLFTKYGVVHLVYGGSSGLQSRPGHLLHWGNTTGEPRQAGDRFGANFAAGDFDGDSAIDFAIGVPGIAAGSTPAAGQVVVLFGGCVFCDSFESGNTSAWQ